ncbi:hypothetical protein niasHT_018631 [Heterodera trifolii]|uniref:Transposase n=1 Tax=Heterodera trifolii TaxID=157864 RepID=A0ABD2KZ97_9BILA
MSVRKCPSANVRPQMSVRKCPSASVRPQMSHCGWTKNENHSHNEILDKNEARNAAERLRQLAREAHPLQTRDAIDEARAVLSAKARVIAPSSAMGKIFRRAKRKAAELQGDQGLDSNIEFAGQQRKIIAFATQASLRMLGTYRSEISIDGTFKTAPKGFGQLFTVHTVIDSCAIPCVFACLPTKHMQGYVRVF